MNLVQLLKNNNTLLNIASFVYNIWFSPSLLKSYFTEGVVIKGAFLKRCKINKVKGGARIEIGPKTIMNKCTIVASGENSIIKIEGGSTNIKNSSFVTGMPNGRILIAEGFTSEGCYLKAHEGKMITIGSDCMFSAGINLSTTDFHAILNLETCRRINHAKDIIIGNHVWLGRNVNVMKGANITDDVVVGMNSMVSSAITVPHSVYAGVPVRIIKEGVSWRRSLN